MSLLCQLICFAFQSMHSVEDDVLNSVVSLFL